ncbi:MAG: hypothetical protein RML72_12165, partial [Bacteroidia bacterium]|nr:hypothetical protein [Bacteroidia bacterium]MDW8159613.1 hypothetical protein [Bacteroidia bacterium]
MIDLALQEKEAQKKGILYTLLILLLLFIISLFWVVVTNTIPPKEEEQYEVKGRLDFGNLREGSGNINNKQKVMQAETPKKAAATPQKAPRTPQT